MFRSWLPDLGALSLHARATEMDAGPSEPRGRITITLPPQYDPRKWERLKAELEMKINALEVDQYIFKLLRELWERRKEWPGLITNDSDADPVRIKKRRKDPLTQYKDITIHWDEMKPDYYEDVLAIVKKHTRQEYEWTKKRQERGFGPSDAQLLREIEERRYKAQRHRDDAQQALDQVQYRPPAADGPAFDWEKEFPAGAAKPEMSDSEDDG